MSVLKVFRHEYKYSISYEEMLRLRAKLNDLLTIDRNSNGYLVRSLYFDSINDIDYYEKLDGLIQRKKIRLRIYEPNANKVKLELKSKYDYHQQKESLIITKKEAEELIKENYSILLNHKEEIASKLYTILTTNCYKPKVVIEYQRIAYTTRNGTRITFDFDIKRSNQIETFFDENINYLDLTNPQNIVLEIKFDRFLEPYISNILGNYISNKESISKYVMGRNI